MAVPGAWTFSRPVNDSANNSITPLITWTAASGAVTYNITIVQENPPGSGTLGGGAYVRAWSGITGTSLQLPTTPNAAGSALGGTLMPKVRYFLYGVAVNGDGTTDNTTPDTQVWLYDSFVTKLGGLRLRGRDRGR